MTTQNLPSGGNGLRAAVGIRNALLLAPFAWAALIAVVAFLFGWL